MAASHGKNTKVLLNQYDISAYLNETVSTKTADATETTTYGQTNKTFIAGLGDGKMAVKGLFDGGAGALDSIAQPILVNPLDCVVTVAETGLGTVGAPCRIANAQMTSYEATSPVADVVSAAAEFQSDGGIDRGVVLAGLRATAFATTDNAASADNTAGTANGGIAVVHVTAYTVVAGTAVVKVQHSTDNTTFADLATVATVSATGFAAVLVAPGTTVNRYLRAQITTTGSSGSVTTTLSFARR